MALQPAGTGSYDRVSRFRKLRIWRIVVGLVALFVAMAGNRAQAQDPHWKTNSLLASSVAPLTISASLPFGKVGAAYAGSVSANGGVAPYKFSLTDGALPSGLTLNGTTGAVSGIPSVAITKYFWVSATDAKGAIAKLHTQIRIFTGSGDSISVTISPTSSSITSGHTQQFGAIVQGTSNTSVTWSASAGSISSGGLFTAPTVSSNSSVTVTATSTADTTKKASATVAVNAPSSVSVTVSPTSSSLASGNTQQFAATVQGTSNTAVTWSATAGSISTAGMFKAPSVTSSSSVTVTATSAADTTKKASASVSVSPSTSSDRKSVV